MDFSLKWNKYCLDLGDRTHLMGVLNVTPDSFSDGGKYFSPAQAVTHGIAMAQDGADIIDIGGESTRPYSRRLPADEEMARVIPVISALSKEIPVPVSIDTYKSEVARQAVDAGARMINDVWGLKYDPAVARVAAEGHVPIIVMQNQRDAQFEDFFPDLISSLRWSIELSVGSGVEWNDIIIDPGIGFGKTLKQNLEVLRRLGELKALGRPILIGPSRKSMVGLVLDLPIDQRLEGTAAAVAIGIANGADMVRVHDTGEMVRVARMSDAIIRGRSKEG